jgi:hypothetical protein
LFWYPEAVMSDDRLYPPDRERPSGSLNKVGDQALSNAPSLRPVDEVEDSYLVRRFHDEVAAADGSTCKKARLAHLELAVRYGILIESASIRCPERSSHGL